MTVASYEKKPDGVTHTRDSHSTWNAHTEYPQKLINMCHVSVLILILPSASPPQSNLQRKMFLKVTL